MAKKSVGSKRADHGVGAVLDALTKSPRFARQQVRKWMRIERAARAVQLEWQDPWDQNGALYPGAETAIAQLCSLLDE